MDQEKIKAQAKQLMDEFMVALEEVDSSDESFGQRRENNRRQKLQKENDPNFSERMLKNAPKTKDRCIQAEKKSW